MDDIVTRLREHADEEKQVGNDLLRDVLCEAADEIERLRGWKAEALEVLNRWDSLCGRTLEVVRLGERKSDAMTAYIESQKAEIERLRQLGDTMAYFVRSGDGKEMYSAVYVWEEARRG